jgi:hypothetical protein
MSSKTDRLDRKVDSNTKNRFNEASGCKKLERWIETVKDNILLTFNLIEAVEIITSVE